MLYFSNPNEAVCNGFRVIDYDVERQLFVVEKEHRPFVIRARHAHYTVIVPQQP